MLDEVNVCYTKLCTDSLIVISRRLVKSNVSYVFPCKKSKNAFGMLHEDRVGTRVGDAPPPASHFQKGFG